MKKLLAALLALLFVVVPVFAGGSSESSKDGTVTISFWDGNWNEPVFAKIQELWNEQHPDIKLQAEFQIDNGQFEKYMLAMQNGTAPDVVACAHDWVTTFGTAGLLEPIDSYVEASGLDLSQYVQGAIDVATVDGKLYGRIDVYADDAGFGKIGEIAAQPDHEDQYGERCDDARHAQPWPASSLQLAHDRSSRAFFELLFRMHGIKGFSDPLIQPHHLPAFL